MQKLLSTFIICLFGIMGYTQEQLTISKAIAYQVACHENNKLEGYWLDIFGKKILGQEYTNAKNSNDEFKLNKIKNTLSGKYEEAIKSLKIGPIYYVTELIDNYSYDFSTSSVKISFGTTDGFGRLTSTNAYDKLDVYTEGGVRRNWITKGFEADDNPVFTISNADNIPIFFEMPVDTAEKSFAQRKGNNRPAFKVRYYFKFWQCRTTGYDVEIEKVELIDDIVNYKKVYVVEPSQQSNNTQSNTSSSNNSSNTNTSSSTSNQQSNSNVKKTNTIYSTEDLKLIEGFIDLNRIEKADKEYFIGQYNQKGFSLFTKGKIRFEQSTEFDDILIGYEQKGEKPETQRRFMYYKGILFYRIGNYLDVVRKLQNGVGIKMFKISPQSSVDEIYYEK